MTSNEIQIRESGLYHDRYNDDINEDYSDEEDIEEEKNIEQEVNEWEFPKIMGRQASYANPIIELVKVIICRLYFLLKKYSL